MSSDEDFYAEHNACPQCGDADHLVTKRVGLRGYDDDGNWYDRCPMKCRTCGWQGIVEDTVRAKPQASDALVFSKLELELATYMNKQTQAFGLDLSMAEAEHTQALNNPPPMSPLSDKALRVGMALRDLQDTCGVVDGLTEVFSSLLGEDLQTVVESDTLTGVIPYRVGAVVVLNKALDDHRYPLGEPVVVIQEEKHPHVGKVYRGMTMNAGVLNCLPWSEFDVVNPASPSQVVDFVRGLRSARDNTPYLRVTMLLSLYCGTFSQDFDSVCIPLPDAD